MRNYPRLSIEDFGRHLLQSGDLDPIYIALVRSQFDPSRLKRWLVAYWCFYHAGFACYASDFPGNKFWEVMKLAGANEVPAPPGGRWPRGHERRHFRAKIAMDSLAELSSRYDHAPAKMVDYLVHGEGVLTFKQVTARAREHRGFGPWMAFKVADMVDRCLGIRVDFDQAAVFMFDDPVKAAYMLWEERRGEQGEVWGFDDDDLGEVPRAKVINTVVDYLTGHFAGQGFTAPPFYDRPVGLQEIETILCKWKSHMNGHYPLNNDIIEIREGASQWVPYSKTAQTFLEHMPNELIGG